MKKKIQYSLILLSLLILISCNNDSKEKAINTSISDSNKANYSTIIDSTTNHANSVDIKIDSIIGDYNGDGKQNFMWVDSPRVKENAEMECEGECRCFIKFSDSSIPPIKVESCIGGTPTNHKDLNQNKSDEIGLVPSWFTSCWKAYYVWTLKNGEWINAVEPFSTHCNQWEDENYVPIEIDKKISGNVIIRYYQISDDENNEDGFITIEKSIKINK